MGRIRRLFKGTLPMFSALWLGMMLVLLWLNSEGQSARMGASMQSYRWSVVFRDLEWICGGEKKAGDFDLAADGRAAVFHRRYHADTGV
jgi:hypothetical protein